MLLDVLEAEVTAVYGRTELEMITQCTEVQRSREDPTPWAAVAPGLDRSRGKTQDVSLYGCRADRAMNSTAMKFLKG